MKLSAIIVLTYTATLSLFAASTSCSGIYFANEAPDILNTKLAQKTKELCYSEFAVIHSGISRTPLFSAEHLSRQQLSHKVGRTDDFHPEERLSTDERAELSDYAHQNGIDRGHLSPAADFDNTQSEHECFTLANMMPQNSENNRGIWSAIEGATRHLAKQKGELYVITGPLFIGSNLQKIHGRVLVPTKIYKAIYDPSTGKAAAYVTDNAPGRNYEVISIAQLDQMAGLNLFPKMSESAKQTAMSLPAPMVRGGGDADSGNSHNENVHRQSHHNEEHGFTAYIDRKVEHYFKGGY
jgi:endonuclease G